MDVPTGLLTGLTQGLQEQLAVFVIVKDRLAPVPTIHHVVNGTGILHSQFSGHADTKSPPPAFVITTLLGPVSRTRFHFCFL